MPSMQEVLVSAAKEWWVDLTLDWLVDESLEPTSDARVERHISLEIGELNVRRVSSGAGFDKLIVGSFVGTTAGPRWTITVKVEKNGRGKTRATYTRSHPDQR
jgi:hypothetical protein